MLFGNSGKKEFTNLFMLLLIRSIRDFQTNLLRNWRMLTCSWNRMFNGCLLICFPFSFIPEKYHTALMKVVQDYRNRNSTLVRHRKLKRLFAPKYFDINCESLDSPNWKKNPVESWQNYQMKETDADKRAVAQYFIWILEMCGSSVCVERAFSKNNRIDTKFRASLSRLRIAKALFCSWNRDLLPHGHKWGPTYRYFENRHLFGM